MGCIKVMLDILYIVLVCMVWYRMWCGGVYYGIHCDCVTMLCVWCCGTCDVVMVWWCIVSLCFAEDCMHSSSGVYGWEWIDCFGYMMM